MRQIKYKLIKSALGLISTANVKIKFGLNEKYTDVLEYEKSMSIENDKKLYVKISSGMNIYNGVFEFNQYPENINIEFKVYPQEVKKAEIIINGLIHYINIE